MLELAAAYEANDQWTEALDEYRKTAQEVASTDYRHARLTDEVRNAPKDYEQAQARFKDHLAALRTAGKTTEAAELEARAQTLQANPSLSQQLNAMLQAGAQAAQKRDFESSLADYKKAVDLAREVQPHDERLVTALDHLGNNYMGRDFAAADATFQEELKVTQELYGAQSPNVEGPLQSLGTSALLQHNFPEAEKFYFRAVDADAKSYGESSDRVALSLVMATRVYVLQKQWDKAEPLLLRAERIQESLYSVDDPNVMIPVATLCNVYDKWGRADKASDCYAHALRIGEKEFGASSPQLAGILAAQAAALKVAGRAGDAQQAEKRAAALRSATMASNP
jgi:tetratricopeptide (TPR) repeat protein